MEIMSVKHKRKPATTKIKPKPRKAKAVKKEPEMLNKRQIAKAQGELTVYLRGLTLDERKKAVLDALEGYMKTTPPDEREEFAEHIHGVGLELLGMVTGIETDNAMVVFPDDPLIQLINLVDHKARANAVPIENVINGLVEQLSKDTQPGYN